MPRTWKRAIVVSWIVTAGVALGQKSRPTKEIAAESYEVYSAVLTQHYSSWFKGKGPVLIYSHTALEPQGHQGCRVQTMTAGVVQDLVGVLLAEKEEFQILPRMRLPGKYEMVKGTAEVRENQEPGIVFFSNVEFSPDRSKAIVLVGHSCGPLCGDGFVWILEKHGDRWSLARDQLNCGWIR